MFVVLAVHADVPREGSPEARVGQVVESIGVALTASTLTSIVLFSAGSLCAFQSIQRFCVYTGKKVVSCR